MKPPEKIRALFYKAKMDGKPLDDAINVWTWIIAFFSLKWGRLKYAYSHMEIWIPDEDGKFTHNQITPLREFNRINPPIAVPDEFKNPDEYLGQCFSSTTRGDASGVRIAPASEVLKHPERWDYIDLPLTGVSKDYWPKVMEWANKQVGKGYDYKGIAGFFSPKPINNPERWYCSEICMRLIYKAWIFNTFEERISPRRSASVLASYYGEPISLEANNGH